MLELTVAAFFFVLGLLIAYFGVQTRTSIFILVGGLVWLVIGVLALTGNVIYDNDYSLVSYTYTNVTVVYNATTNVTISNLPVNTGINTTTHLVTMNNGSDIKQLATAGLYGWVLLGLGLVMVGTFIFEFLKGGPET